MRGYYEFNKIYHDTRLLCVIDCRNKNSINAVYSATERINRKRDLDDPLTSRIISYYLVTDKDNNMLEAPTIVVETKSSDTYSTGERPTVEYKRKEREQFISLLKTLRKALTEGFDKEPIVNIDEAGIVSYYELKDNSILPLVIPNGTEQGNDRVPRIDEFVVEPYQLKLVR